MLNHGLAPLPLPQLLSTLALAVLLFVITRRRLK
jgi:hypothetical protein